MTPALAAGLLLLGLAAAVALGYAAWVEPRRFTLERVEIPLARWPAALDGYTICHVSDLHTRGEGPVEVWLRRLPETLPPVDLVVFTGDFAERSAALGWAAVAIAAFRGRDGRYAVLGNNDVDDPAHEQRVRATLADLGIPVLSDTAVRLSRDGAGWWLGGLDWLDLHRHPELTFPVGQVFSAADTGEPRVLLAHTPDALLEAEAAGVDLVLCGHTHGGQICLPGGRAVINNLNRFSPAEITRGLHHRGGTTLYVSRGLGMTRPRLRAWSRPEVALLVLRSGRVS